MKLLIDADYIVYKCCAACETEIDYGEDVILVTSNFSEAYSAVKREISNIQMQFGSFAKPTLFFSDSKNFSQNTRVTETERSPVDTNVSYQDLRLSMMLSSCHNWRPMMLWASLPPSLKGISLFLLTKT